MAKYDETEICTIVFLSVGNKYCFLKVDPIVCYFLLNIYDDQRKMLTKYQLRH